MIDLNHVGIYNLRLTNICNSNCAYCGIRSYCSHGEKKIEEIQPDRLRKLIFEEIEEDKTLLISALGEPTLYLSKYKMYDIFNENKFFVLQTNGTIVDDSFLEALSCNDNWRITISIGGLKEEYKKITDTDFYDTVVKNIKKISSLSTGLLEVKMILTKFNSHQVLDFVNLCVENNVNQMSISNLCRGTYPQGQLTDEEIKSVFSDDIVEKIINIGKQNEMGVNCPIGPNYKSELYEKKNRAAWLGYVLDEDGICKSAYDLTFQANGTIGTDCRYSAAKDPSFPFTYYEKSLEEIKFSEERKNLIENHMNRYSCQWCIGFSKKEKNLFRTYEQDEFFEAQNYSEPALYSFLTNTDCNLNCPYCIAAGWRDKMNGEINPQKFIDIVNDIEGEKSLYLSGGEPTLYLDRYGLHRVFFENKHYKILQTNGVKFSDRLLTSLEQSDKWRIAISIAGLNDLYEYAHKKNCYQNVIDNIEKVNSIKKQNSMISLNFLLMKSNLHQINDFIKISEDIGVDHIMLTKMQNSGSEFALSESQFDLSEIDKEEIQTYINSSKLMISFPAFSINVNNGNKKFSSKLFLYRNPIDELGNCKSLYDLVFWPNGSITQCCRCRSEEDFFSFDMYREDLKGIINSVDRTERIENYRTRKSCKKCMDMSPQQKNNSINDENKCEKAEECNVKEKDIVSYWSEFQPYNSQNISFSLFKEMKNNIYLQIGLKDKLNVYFKQDEKQGLLRLMAFSNQFYIKDLKSEYATVMLIGNNELLKLHKRYKEIENSSLLTKEEKLDYLNSIKWLYYLDKKHWKYPIEVENINKEDVIWPNKWEYLKYKDFEDKIVLDYGCGTGVISSEFYNIAQQVYLYDISSLALEYSKLLLWKAKIVNNPKDIINIYKDNVDVVISNSVLIHLPKFYIYQFFEDVLPILKEDGKIIVNFSNIDKKVNTDVDFPIDVAYYHYYSDEEIGEFCDKYNLKVEYRNDTDERKNFILTKKCDKNE